ncbi:MAG: hypothetical protein WCV84_05955 [Patescibacteria group bacterium]
MKKSSAVEEDRDVALHYIKIFSDTVREPFLILDLDLKIVGANEFFYKKFRVSKKETENRYVYELGNGQWNIPELKRLLETILPEKNTFDDFEVSHKFPDIGKRVMLLNARRFDATQMILLAIEDISLHRAVEMKLAKYTKKLQSGMAKKTEELEARIDELSTIKSYLSGQEMKIMALEDEIEEIQLKGIIQ